MNVGAGSGSTAPEQQRWHALSAAGALSALGSDPDGLSEEEAQRRLARYGANALVSSPPEAAWRIFVRQFKSIVIALLVAAMVLAWFTGDPLDTLAIAVVLVLNVAIGFITELRARRAMEALVRLDVPFALVVRAGTRRQVDARELVPGDVIELEAGEAVPADARLLATTELQTIEAALTGESTAVLKHAHARLSADASLPDRVTMVYKGTTVADGVGRAVVVATAMATEVGRIGTLVRGIADEPSPLERRMDALGRQLAVIAIVIGVAVALVDLVRGATLGVVLEMGIAVAIAAVPEGLPAVVTTTMAIAMRRMVRRHALARRLPAVEALGSVTVVCTDKTGTLTAGTQTVTSIWTPSHGTSVDEDLLNRALVVGALANRASAQHGDPTEIALLVAARDRGIDRDALLRERPEIGEIPFSSTRMMMATVHRVDGKLVAFAKGAPHRLLGRCARVATVSGDVPLDTEWRHTIEHHASSMAGGGLRILALADGVVTGTDEQALRDLTLVGLVGISDPPAEGVVETIAALRGAGIRTLMLTGDHRATALAIAREIGLVSESDELLDGREIDSLADDPLTARVARVGVVSRISPEGKLRVVAALQRRGDVVAMLGDGINDAAALKKADIGVAMGRRGTDAAKEVAGIVLEDDRFATIAAAVEQGRVVVANIRKFVFYLFSCNIAEIISLLVAGIAGLPLPMTPLQVLWMNLVTDTFPALALAIEPAEPNVLRNPPRNPRAPLLSRREVVHAVMYSLLISGVTLGALIVALRLWPANPARAVTMSFTVLALAQIFHLGNARSRGPVTTRRRIMANRYAIGAVVLTVTLQVLAVAFRPLGSVLGTVPLERTGWLIAFGLSVVPAIAGQLWKLTYAREA